MDTCRNEHVHKMVADSRTKGRHCGIPLYVALTNIGLLRANQVAHSRIEPTTGLWQSQLCGMLGVRYTPAMRAEELKRHGKHVKRADEVATEFGRYKRMKDKQRRGMQAAARKKHDGSCAYTPGQAAKVMGTQFRLPEQGVLIALDIETPGFGPYIDAIVELACTIRSYVDGGKTFTDEASFTGISTAQCFNPVVKLDRSHLSLDVLRGAQTEDQLMLSWVQFLRDTLESVSVRPVFLVAHNGKVCDIPAIHRALGRAGLVTRDIFSKLGIVGVLDTLWVSRNLVNWSVYVTDSDATIVEDLAAAEFDFAEAVVEGHELQALATHKHTTSHSLGAVYARIFNAPLQGAHHASVDVDALIAVLEHDAFWAPVLKFPSAFPVNEILAQADENCMSYVTSMGGWRMEHYPTCEHGRMKPTPAQEDDAGWVVQFNCVMKACPSQQEGLFSGFKMPEKQPRRSIKPKRDNGTPGKCTCTGTCQRGCPCAKSGVKCTAECLKCQKPGSCKNKHGAPYMEHTTGSNTGDTPTQTHTRKHVHTHAHTRTHTPGHAITAALAIHTNRHLIRLQRIGRTWG